MHQKKVYHTHLTGIARDIHLGPVCFNTNDQGYIEASVEGDFSQILDALHLLYFSSNAYKIYYELNRDPILNFFEHAEAPYAFDIGKVDKSLLNSFSNLLNLKTPQAHRIIQAIKCLNESVASKENGMPEEPWKTYLLLSKGFEVLFSLNPSFPAADLRQHLRPLLHLKFSHPVELLWKWVDKFYAIQNSILMGESPFEPLYLENPDIQVPTLLIAEKLLIYSIYDTLFSVRLLEGSAGTLSTPDDFSFIHPERVLVYFWTQTTLQKKATLLKLQPNSEKELKMISKIEDMYSQKKF